MVKQPNFILFITNQHHADFQGCNGHPLVKSPNVGAMAAAGVNFDRFYVSSPVCMPNRASLMTGRMPSVHGVRSIDGRGHLCQPISGRRTRNQLSQ